VRERPIQIRQTEKRLFAADEHFAVREDDVIERETVPVRAGIQAGANGSADQTDSGRSLKNIRRKRAALRVEFDLQVAGVGIPDSLVAGIEYHYLGNYAYQHIFFSHAEVSLKFKLEQTIVTTVR
jgi:hypothetical protein